MRSLFFKIFACFWLSHLIVVSLLFALVTRAEPPNLQVRQDWERRFNSGTITTLSGQQLGQYADAAAALWNAPGKSEATRRADLKRYFDGLERTTRLRPALFDARDNLLLGQVTAETKLLVPRARQSGETEFAQGRGAFTTARAAHTFGGARLTFTLARGNWGFGRGGDRDTSAAGSSPPSASSPGPAATVAIPAGMSSSTSTSAAGSVASLRPEGREGRERRGGPPGFLFGIRMDRRQAEGIARLISVFLAAGMVAFGLARYLTAPTIQLRRATQQLAAGDLSARVGSKMGRRRDELADLGRDFDQMAERIQGLMVAERRLLGDISHELGSPLARLKLALELAQQGADGETQQYLGRIDREADRLDALIGQLLTLTRLETAGTAADSLTSGDVATIDLAGLTEEVCADANFEAQSQGRSVSLLASEACHLHGNPELLRSAIENVVRNAILHAPQSSAIEVRLQVLPPEEQENGAAGAPAAGPAQSQARITVRDHGAGVPETELSELFKPFYRVAEARDRRSGGVGLGLSITERAVRFHGGTVRASNAPDGGLIVEILLPLAP